MKASEFREWLIQRGWVEDRHAKGSHTIFRYPENNRTFVLQGNFQDKGHRLDNMKALAKRVENMPSEGNHVAARNLIAPKRELAFTAPKPIELAVESLVVAKPLPDPAPAQAEAFAVEPEPPAASPREQKATRKRVSQSVFEVVDVLSPGESFTVASLYPLVVQHHGGFEAQLANVAVALKRLAIKGLLRAEESSERNEGQQGGRRPMRYTKLAPPAPDPIPEPPARAEGLSAEDRIALLEQTVTELRLTLNTMHRRINRIMDKIGGE